MVVYLYIFIDDGFFEQQSLSYAHIFIYHILIQYIVIFRNIVLFLSETSCVKCKN